MKYTPQIFETKGIKALIKLLNLFLGISGFALIILISYYVVTRYIFHMNFHGFEEITLLLCVWLYMMGAAKGSHDETHISADLLNVFVKDETTRLRFRVVRRVIAVAVMCVMLYLSVDFVLYNIEFMSRTSQLHIPMVAYYVSLALGFLLMLFFDACYMVCDIKVLLGLTRGKEGKTE